MNMLDSGSATRPEASGQIPASARNRVDLPLPDGPLSRMLSPGCTCSAVWASRRLPVGSASVRSLACRPPLAAVSRSRGAASLALRMADSKCVRRSVVARQAARLS